ncbi:hypothetical protein EWM62_14160 [Mucilaginibacter terrigena]|uniref:Uncharacterized protein n=1 Tax=Mucilaginibacter terrigena TaxID=2492395 RepID=A0A4Q5LJ62_9SPHI|nr:hypothetical protein [Mucilaginibacter terrigena]RYU89461.1 hypothetical protein EWM62_14160 [Mucilaginibacter terrigena]
MELTQPNIFHIHIDAKKMPQLFDEFAIKELGFYDTDFNGHPEGYQHFEPIRHLTLKVKTKEDFSEIWDKLELKTNEHPDFVGYLEGEFIPKDEYIPYKEFTDHPVPFKIERRVLSGSEKEAFRQTEFHLTMEKSQSSPVLMKRLLDSGLYGAYIPKKDGEFLVLTMQGFIKDIVPLYEILKSYILKTGGAYRCTIKEERAIKFKMYGIASVDLPEIAGNIQYLVQA